jgi:hypothetical protein
MKGFRSHTARRLLALALATLFLASLTLLLVAAAPAPQGSSPPDWSNLVSVLTWIAAGGAFYYIGKGLSLLLEKVPGWGSKFPAFLRPWTVMAIGVGAAFGAQYLITQVDLLAKLSPWFERVILLGFIWYGTQTQFEELKAAGRISRPLPA